MVVCNGKLTASGIFGRRERDVGFVVLEPALDGASLRGQLARDDRYVAAVIDDVMPLLLKNLGNLQIFGIHHQTAGFAIQAMDRVGGTFEMAFGKVFVQHLLRGILLGGRGHGEDALRLLNDN